MVTGALVGSQLRLRCCAGILVPCLLLPACSVTPAVRPDSATDCPPAPVIVSRAPADVERISELEAEVANVQRQLADKQKQLVERNRQSNDEKQRLETHIRENQQRASELQAKLDGILAIDRELRRTSRPAD